MGFIRDHVNPAVCQGADGLYEHLNQRLQFKRPAGAPILRGTHAFRQRPEGFLVDAAGGIIRAVVRLFHNPP